MLHTSSATRPAYEHHAPDGTAVYLYFVEQTAAGPCPRWVIGPNPAGTGAEGWAYSDSNAMRPEDIVEPWRSWSKDSGEWGEARLAFSAKGAAIGTDPNDDDSVRSSGGEGAPGGVDGAGEGGAARKGKKSAKKKGGGKGGSKKKGGEGKAKAGKAKATKA